MVSLTYLPAALLGIVQGLTEFLPISSTAHLLLGARVLGFQDPGGVFTVMIQLGAVLAVVWLYRARVWEVLVGLPSPGPARQFGLAVALACVPAFVAGALLADYVKAVLYYSPAVMAWAFVLGGLAMLAAERWRPRAVPTADPPAGEIFEHQHVEAGEQDENDLGVEERDFDVPDRLAHEEQDAKNRRKNKARPSPRQHLVRNLADGSIARHEPRQP